MRVILVIERKHLFPRLSPHGFLANDHLNLDDLAPHLFFAEREYMETNSHYKQIIPYLVLQRGQGRQTRLLAYQRRVTHSEARLGGLWSVGFGGHIEPLDREDEDGATKGLVQTAALRELAEETGLELTGRHLERIGYINSDHDDVSSVHFGVVYLVDLDSYEADDDQIKSVVCRQAEPYQARWLRLAALQELVTSGGELDGSGFENWSRIAIEGLCQIDTDGSCARVSSA